MMPSMNNIDQGQGQRGCLQVYPLPGATWWCHFISDSFATMKHETESLVDIGSQLESLVYTVHLGNHVEVTFKTRVTLKSSWDSFKSALKTQWHMCMFIFIFCMFIFIFFISIIHFATSYNYIQSNLFYSVIFYIS